MAMSSPSISTHPPRTPVDADVDMDDPETENDEEIDQLDSDTTEDEDVPAASSSPASPTKARLKRAGERVPGHSIIPMTRIEDMLDAEGLENHMSKEAVFLMAVAAGEFVKRLTQAGQRQAGQEQRSMVNYHDVACAVQENPALSFLEETIPMPLSVAEALDRRAAKEKELLEPETAAATAVPSPSLQSTATTPPPPAASSSASASRPTKTIKPKGRTRGHHEPEMGTFSPASTPITVPPAPSSASPRSQRTKGKARETAKHTNGHAPADTTRPTSTGSNAKINNSVGDRAPPVPSKASSKATSVSTNAVPSEVSAPPSTISARRQSLREPKPRRRPDDEDDARNKETSSKNAPATKSSPDAPRAKRTRRASARSNGANGSGTAHKDEPPSAPSSHFPPEYLEAHADSPEETWPVEKFTGPASGYMDSNARAEERRLLYSRQNGISDNPGRTIYSQRQLTR